MLPYRYVLVFTMVVLFMTTLFFNDILADEERQGIEFSGMNLVINADLEPNFLIANDTDRKNLSIRIFDTITNKNLEMVTYRVEIWQDDEMLARNLFYDIDGLINLEIKPEKNCSEIKLYQCTKYFGSEHVSAPGAIYVQNEGSALITGPVFVKSGLYKIKVDIEGAIGPTNLTANVPSFETFVSITKEQEFVIQTTEAQKIPITIQSYFDIDDLKFDQSDNSLSFDIQFNWDHDYINQIQTVHQELRIPKSFEPYSEGQYFRGFINNIEVENRSLLFDPYSFKNTNIIHLLITENELERINENSDFLNNMDTMKFKVVPYGEITKKSIEFYLVDTNTFERVDTTVNIAWDSKFGAGDDIPFEITFFDENRNLIKDVRYTYHLLKDDQFIEASGGVDPNNPGIFAIEGIDIQKIFIPSEGRFQLDILVHGTGFDYDLTYAGIGSAIIEIGPSVPTTPGGGTGDPPIIPPAAIPEWIKNNAGWWAEGAIGDTDFIQGIQFLIREGIMKIPPTTQGPGSGGNEIPEWIKNNAAWWAEGAIGDTDFIQGIQFLIKEGIMSLES